MHHVGVLVVVVEQRFVSIGHNFAPVHGHRHAVDGLSGLTVFHNTSKHNLFRTVQTTELHNRAESSKGLKPLVTHVHV